MTNGPDGSIYAGNPDDAFGDLAGYRVVRYDGSDWHGVGPREEGTSGRVAHVSADGRVYVATGVICEIGIPCRVEVYALEGNAWKPIGVFVEDGPTDSDYPFFVYDFDTDASGRLYAAGRFTRVFAGGDNGLTGASVEAANLAVWDGTFWSDVDRGLAVTDERNDDRRALVRDVQVIGDSVWVGGFFDEAGDGIPSLGIARFGATPVTSERPPQILHDGITTSIYPNPAHGQATLDVDLTQATQRLRITIHDVLGRTVGRIADGPASTGRNQFRIPTHGLAAGVYLVRVDDGARVSARRFVVL